MASFPRTSRPEIDWENADADEDEGNGAAWGMLWVLIGFKFFSIALILAMNLSSTSLAMMFWLNWPWFVLVAAIAGISGLAWYRLVRVRLKRQQLLRAEWDVAPSEREHRGVR